MGDKFEATFHGALLDYLKKFGAHLDAKEVTGYEDDTESSGYCDTCWYEEAIVRICYKNANDEVLEHTYYGSFADLIRSL